MDDSLFVAASDLSWMVELLATFVAYGIGLAFAVWCVGFVVVFLFDVMRF